MVLQKGTSTLATQHLGMGMLRGCKLQLNLKRDLKEYRPCEVSSMRLHVSLGEASAEPVCGKVRL